VLHSIKGHEKTGISPSCNDEKQEIRELVKTLAPVGGKKKGHSIVQKTIGIFCIASCITSKVFENNSVGQRRTACDDLARPKLLVTLRHGMSTTYHGKVDLRPPRTTLDSLQERLANAEKDLRNTLGDPIPGAHPP
jgi:hypothetical protein